MFTHWENSGTIITLELTQQLIAEIVSENNTVEQVNLDVIYLINNFPSGQAVINIFKGIERLIYGTSRLTYLA